MAQLERGHLPTSLRGSLSPEATQVLTMAQVICLPEMSARLDGIVRRTLTITSDPNGD